MASFWQDLRYNLRLLRLSPRFTLVAILTLALGIGANTAIFQLIDSIRLRTIPVKNPEQLGTVRIADRHWGSGQFSSKYSQLTFPMWEEIRKRCPVIELMDEPKRIYSSFVHGISSLPVRIRA